MDTTEQPTVQKIKIEFRQMVSFYTELTVDEFVDLHEDKEDQLTEDQMAQLRSELLKVFNKLTKRKNHLIIERNPYNQGKLVYAGPDSTSALQIKHDLFMKFGILRELLRGFLGLNHREI